MDKSLAEQADRQTASCVKCAWRQTAMHILLHCPGHGQSGAYRRTEDTSHLRQPYELYNAEIPEGVWVVGVEACTREREK